LLRKTNKILFCNNGGVLLPLTKESFYCVFRQLGPSILIKDGPPIPMNLGHRTRFHSDVFLANVQCHWIKIQFLKKSGPGQSKSITIFFIFK
jgi:hypothetical protein